MRAAGFPTWSRPTLEASNNKLSDDEQLADDRTPYEQIADSRTPYETSAGPSAAMRVGMHALISLACALFVAGMCVAKYCLANRRRRRRIPFINQDTEESKKNPGRLSAAAARAARTGDARLIGEWIELVGKGGLDARGNLGRTAMHFAADMGQGGVIKLLLDAGADVHTQDSAGQTALHVVSTNGHGTCVKMLLDAGADPSLTDSNGDSALALAERGGRVGSVRLMRLHISQSRALYGGMSSPTGGESTPRHR